MNLNDAWAALRHGGNLLSPAALADLPEPSAPPYSLADRLRAARTAFDPAKPAKTLSALLDVALEDACGLDRWEKGSMLGAADAERLLDGTILKPRRRRAPSGATPLALFTTPATRLGVGKGRRPVAQVIEYLRRRALPLGVLTNGAQWRLIWADTDSLAWVEWEAERWLEGDQPSPELLLLRRVLSQKALALTEGGLSPLLEAIRETRRGQARLSKELGERVRRAVEALLRSRAARVNPAWGEHRASDLYVGASHFIMRLVVTLFAEARELLPVDNPIYHQGYGLRGLLDQLDRLTPERRKARQSAWPRLLALFKLLHQGSPHPEMTLPAYGGDLFAPGDPDGEPLSRAIALLEGFDASPSDEVVYQTLLLLTRTTQRIREGSTWRRVAAPVDFTELTSEYIGILYEGLLDYELRRAGDEPIVFLNLGDQPALPLDRLESMDDKALKALVGKAKVKGKAEDEDEAPEDEGEEAPEEDEGEEAPEEDEAEEVEEVDEAPDDPRAVARARAIAWGRRAAEVGKFVNKPNGKNAKALHLTLLDSAAKQLVADLKLPGELYLVRWGGTRKGAGTFYTRPQLTMPTVRRTLEPLIYEGEGEARRIREPEALLALKVCDPAMGSGSFLVAALRELSKALVESIHTHERIKRFARHARINLKSLSKADRSVSLEGFEEGLEALARRAVVEHCLYGVDLDPLAVELARVALWVETLDRKLPFTFLDHKLRCGNALVGTWWDRFRDYPLLCFERESPDRKYKGVHHPADVWHEALKAKRQQAIEAQAEILSGQIPMSFMGLDKDTVSGVLARVQSRYAALREVSLSAPEAQARIWREEIQGDTDFARVREAFDTWCALWFWPLDQLDALPLPRRLHAQDEAARRVVRAVQARQRFFHWELEFPDVFTHEGAGFDVVVGNPPWEIQKPNSKEFFSNHDPLYREYGKQEALRVQKALFETHPVIEFDWLAYNGDFKDRGSFVKHAAEPFGDGKVAGHGGGDVVLERGRANAQHHAFWAEWRDEHQSLSDPAHPFRHQGSADLNTYKMFIEVGHALLCARGQLGLIVPSGVYTDKGTGDLRRLLLQACDWRWLYGFENRKKLFEIDSRFKFCVLIATKGGQAQALQAAFMRHDLEDWAEARGALDYPAERISTFSPKSLSVLEIRSERDLEVLTKLYANGVLLGDDGPEGWGIKYSTEFHMTNDSKLFIPRDQAEAQGFVADIYGRWVNEEGEVLLPLYEGRMIGQFDFSEKGWVSGKGRSAVWREIPWSEKTIEPQYLIKKEDFISFGYAFDGNARAVFMDVTSSTNRRTMISALIPPYPSGNKVPILSTRFKSTALVGSLCSVTFDWQLRQRLGGITLNYFIVEETGLPDPNRTVR
ncbi:hypothetical protein KKB55_11135, partial [Myxococcota bacterium]|nr:hypothetical protein [Myxococcota bacterium]